MYRLRELEYKDLEEINKWRNDKDIIDQLGAPFRFINFKVDEIWFDNYMKNRSSNVRCSIIDDESKLIGLVSLTGINMLNQSADFHIMIGNKESQGKGAGTFAVKEILNHAFNNLNLHRVELTVLKNNERAMKLYEKSGFKREGTLRQVYYKNGSFVDAYIYSILKDEYLTLWGQAVRPARA
mgnify:CR=1 FL=1